MNAACNHKQKQTHTFTRLCACLFSHPLSFLSQTHTPSLCSTYTHTYISLQPNLHIYFIFHVCLKMYSQNFLLELHSTLTVWQKKKHSYTLLLIRYSYPCVTAQCDANKRDCNLLSSDSQLWQGIKQTTVGDVFGFGSKPGARSLC